MLQQVELADDLGMADLAFIHAPRQLVIFRVASTLYGIDIAEVAEILAPLPVTTVAEAPGGVLGLVDVRKRVVPVFDLHWKFGVPRDVAAPSRMIMVENTEGPVALLVDSVEEVATIDPEAYHRVNTPGDTRAMSYLRGCVRRNDQLVLWVDHAFLIPEGVAPPASHAA
jgi:purine-binding chemotaxis protein CheW